MNDNIKFYDPETGLLLYLVPDGAMIPPSTPYGFIRRDGTRGWKDGGVEYAFDQLHDFAYFTREPLPAPMPPLPTKPGTLIRALLLGDNTALLLRDYNGRWTGVDDTGQRWLVCSEDAVKFVTDWELMIPAPAETWNRLRVLDPEDKRDRIDRYGRFVRHSERIGELWEWELARASRNYGPLRFADEVDDQ